MHTYLRKVGNSRGVIIPASFIETCSLTDDVNLRIEGDKIVIEAFKKTREGWFDGYQEELNDDTWNDTLPDDVAEEWEW